MYAIIKVKEEVLTPSVIRYALKKSSVIVPCFKMVSEGHVNIEDAMEWISTQPSEEQDYYRIIRFY